MIKRIISAGVLCCLAALTGCGSQKTTVPNTVQNGTIAKTAAVSESSAEDVTEGEREAVTVPCNFDRQRIRLPVNSAMLSLP